MQMQCSGLQKVLWFAGLLVAQLLEVTVALKAGSVPSSHAQTGAARQPCNTSAPAILQPQPVPVAGDFLSNVGNRLDLTHNSLGKVSQVLLSVQTSVDHTEESILGQVMDLQTARTLMSSHEKLLLEIEEDEAELAKLNGQVEDLSSRLGKSRKQMRTSAQQQAAEESKLRYELIKKQTIVEGLEAEVDKEGDLDEQLKALQEAHTTLMKVFNKESNAKRDASQQLRHQRSTNHAEADDLQREKEAFNQIYKYNLGCAADASKAKRELQSLIAREDVASDLNARHAWKASVAGVQRLHMEQLMIKSEIKNVERTAVEEMEELKKMYKEMISTQQTILDQVEDLQFQVNAAEATVRGKTAELLKQAEDENETMAEQQTVYYSKAVLMKRVQDKETIGTTETLQLQNEALQRQVNNATALYAAVKADEVTAMATAKQAALEADAAAQAAKAAAEMVATQSANGLKELKEHGRSMWESLKQIAEHKAQSEEALAEAEAAAVEKCEDYFQKQQGVLQEKVSKCQGLIQDLKKMKKEEEALLTEVHGVSADTLS